jgi:hypothetical protein
MALKRSIDNTQKLGAVTVVQSAIVADSPDNDVTSVAASGAKNIMSMQIVNGSQSAFYVKFQDALTAASNSASHSCIYVASGTTQFIGFGRGLPFGTAISVLVSTTPTNSTGSVISGTSSYTLIASESATY